MSLLFFVLIWKCATGYYLGKFMKELLKIKNFKKAIDFY